MDGRASNQDFCVNQDHGKTTDNPVLELPDGSRQLLTYTGATTPLMVSAQRWRVDCLPNSGGVIAYSPDGMRYEMTQLVNLGETTFVPAWYTRKITDPNGNTATVNYLSNSSPQIQSVTTSDGRSISFTYADSGLTTRRITRISASGGQVYEYSYTALSGVTGVFLLTGVRRPDGTSWGYAYNTALYTTVPGKFSISRVTYPQGGSISYEYAHVFFDPANSASRTAAVSRKVASTGGTWTFQYAPGTNGALDTTTVNTPAGQIVYRHVGPHAVSYGSTWMVGLLMSKQYANLQTETYRWAKQRLSSETYSRPGVFWSKTDPNETNAPLLAEKVIGRNGATYRTTYSDFDAYGNPRTISEAGPMGGAGPQAGRTMSTRVSGSSSVSRTRPTPVAAPHALSTRAAT
ncbi:hypothetical protein HUS23_10095 [Ectothiorhodospiraceae bacterium 2226]|nr:hypothetical protein HUS23_10095 [Ectothiorhodospiraceae bacterium 2226]